MSSNYFFKLFFSVPSLIWAVIVSILLGGPGAHTSFGELLASDSASNAAYLPESGGAWKGINPTSDENLPGNDNGGFGYSPWDFVGGYHSSNRSPYEKLNHFIDGVDVSTSSFNDLGSPAFGLTNANRAFAGYTSRATRSFSPLQVGQTLSIEFDSPLLQPLESRDYAGYLFRLNTGGGPVIENSPIPGVKERFGIATTSGFNSNRWYLTDSQNSVDTGVSDADTSSGAIFLFTRTGSESYDMEFKRLIDGASLYSRSGMLKNSGFGEIDTIEITLFGNGSGDGTNSGIPSGEREFFFNNLQIYSPMGLEGDFDQDSDVDGRDFLIWQKGNSPTSLSTSDLEDWQSNFGGGQTPQLGYIAVPEPKGVEMLALAIFLCVLLLRTRCDILPIGRKEIER